MYSTSSKISILMAAFSVLCLSGCGIQKYIWQDDQSVAEEIVDKYYLEIKAYNDKYSVAFAETSIRLLQISAMYPSVSVLDPDPNVVIDDDGQARTQAEIDARKPYLKKLEDIKEKFRKQMVDVKSKIRRQLTEKGISSQIANKAWNKVILARLVMSYDSGASGIIGKLYG